MLVVKVGCDGVHQDWEGRHAPQVAGLSHRQDPLHPAVPLLVVGALHHQHGKPQRPVELSTAWRVRDVHRVSGRDSDDEPPQG